MDKSTLPVVLIVAVVSGAAGWFLHTPPANTAPAAATASAQPSAEPKAAPVAVSPKAQVAAPAVAPAPVDKPVAVATMTSPPPASASATADLSTPAPSTPGVTPPELTNMITEMNTLMQTGDLVAVYENYSPPQKMAALTPEQKSYIENQIQQRIQGPDGQNVLHGQMEIIQALATLTPVMNSAGDHASYQVPTPKDMAPAGTNLPSTLPINFVKIDGRWYIDQ